MEDRTDRFLEEHDEVSDAVRAAIPVLAVAIGGSIGAVARFLISSLLSPRETKLFVLTGTVAANVLGCLLIGLLVAVIPKDAALWRLGLITGLLGSLTTFSTFAYETVALIEKRQFLLATVNAVGSVVLGLAAVALGLWIGERLRG